MPSLKLRSALGAIGQWAMPSAPPTPDQVLLEQFIGDKIEAAFADLMNRHAPMVLGVCRRNLSNAHDAEDACQAVFLLLARKAGSIRKTASLASWLHGVARHVSCKLRVRLAKHAA